MISEISWLKMDKHLKLICIAWVLCVAYLFLHQVIKRYEKLISKTQVSFQQALLPNYFAALKLNHIEEFVNSENEVRGYGFNILDDEALEKIMAQKNKVFGDKQYDSEMSSNMISERNLSGGFQSSWRGEDATKKMEHSNPVY